MRIVKLLVMAMFLTGCGPSQKQLKVIDQILVDAESASCVTIMNYLTALHVEIRKMIK